MGLMAGPERPPVMLAMRGRRVSTSMDRARKVLTREMASAPASCGDVGHGGNAGDVRRELDDERATCAACLARETSCVERVGVGAEDHAAVAGVGAGGVELVGGDAFGVVEARG